MKPKICYSFKYRLISGTFIQFILPQGFKAAENKLSAEQRLKRSVCFGLKIIFPIRQHDPFVQLVLNLCQKAHIGLAFPFRRKGSSKHSRCTTRKYVSVNSPYVEFQAHIPQKILYLQEVMEVSRNHVRTLPSPSKLGMGEIQGPPNYIKKLIDKAVCDVDVLPLKC